MDIFNKIGEKITSTSKDVAKRTKNLADITKINSQISNEENNIRSKYSEIGKQYYRLFHDSPDEMFVELCNSITDSLSKIKCYKKQICSIKGVITCAKCCAEVPDSSIYCGSCGTKIEQSVQETAEDVSKPKCPQCSSDVSDDMMFCTKCGEKLK